jgi:hypothetical protein
MEVRISIPVGRRRATPAEPAARSQHHSGKPETQEARRAIDGNFAEKQTKAVIDPSSV